MHNGRELMIWTAFSIFVGKILGHGAINWGFVVELEVFLEKRGDRKVKVEKGECRNDPEQCESVEIR